MTPANFEKIALWMGWAKHGDHHGEYWACQFTDGRGWDWCKDIEEASLTDAEAVEALNRLVEKGYAPNLRYTGPDCYDWALSISAEHGFNSEPSTDYWGRGSTIHEAVEAALLQMIAAEAREQPDTVREEK